jgi:hypothetical protein
MNSRLGWQGVDGSQMTNPGTEGWLLRAQGLGPSLSVANNDDPRSARDHPGVDLSYCLQLAYAAFSSNLWPSTRSQSPISVSFIPLGICLTCYPAFSHHVALEYTLIPVTTSWVTPRTTWIRSSLKILRLRKPYWKVSAYIFIVVSLLYSCVK